MACPEPAAFSAFVSGELAPAARDVLEAHVDECSTCRLTLSELGRRLAAGSAPVTKASPDEHPAIGTLVGRYEISSELGAGAMGTVFRARDPELGREVALKLVHRQRGEAETEIADQRTLREGRILARIDHPNVVRVFDVGRWHGAVFVAMEHVDGPSLRLWLATSRTRAQIIDVFAQCARGLAAAHAAGVVHRDFKPDNAVIDERNRARVTDFGLARTSEQSEEIATQPADDTVDHRLTRTRGVVGTPAYMAPEQLRGEPSDARADQYAWCIACVEALTGARPFRASTTTDLLVAMKRSPALPEGERRLRRVLAHGLSFAPADRYPSMDALLDELATVPELAATGKRRTGAFAGILALAVIVGGALALAGRGTRHAADPCANLDAPIARVWNPERRAQLAAAGTNVNKPFAARSAAYVIAATAAYAQRWHTARVDVCRAGVERGELDAASRARTIECLDRRAVELDVVLTRSSASTADALSAAPGLVDSLAPIERCATSEQAPATSDVERAQRLAVTARLAAARVLGESGKASEAVSLLRDLVRDLAPHLSSEPGPPTVVPRFASEYAEALSDLAEQERNLGQRDASRDHLIAALAAAETAHADRVRVQAWLSIAQLRADDYAQITEARDALRLAAAVLANVGNPAPLMRVYDLTRGLVALAAAEPPEAIAAFRSSLEDPSLTPPLRAQRMQILARGLLAAGDYAGALAQLDAAEKLLVAALGPDAPQLVYILNSSMEPLEYLGRLDDALSRGERALALFDASYGTAHPRRAALVGNLAAMYASANQLERARVLEEQVLVLMLATPERDRDPASLAIAYLNLGSTLTDLERWRDALAPLAQARSLFTQAFGPATPQLANVASTLYQVHDRLGHHAEALANAELAVSLREQAHVPAPYLAVSLIQLADALLVAGQRTRALEVGKRAAAIPLATTGREAGLRQEIQTWIKANAR